jgi:hypothetical protein
MLHNRPHIACEEIHAATAAAVGRAAHPAEHVQAWLVCKADILEVHLAGAEHQLGRIWGVQHLALGVQQLQQVLHV